MATLTSITIRAAELRDAERIFALIDLNRDLLVPRSMGNIVENIDRFFIAETAGELAGIVCYQIHPELGSAEAAIVEIQSLAVKSVFRRQGIGAKLVMKVLERVRPIRPQMVIALTFTPPFFASLGFAEIPKSKVMHKLYTGCINCTKHTDPFTCPERAMAIGVTEFAGTRLTAPSRARSVTRSL